MTAGLELSGVSKSFRETPVLRGVDLVVPEGCLTVVVGASGSGKTTLLRIVAGLEAADEGRVEVGGRDVASLPPADREVAMVFQHGGLFPHLSVFENVAFGLRVRRVSRAEVRNRVSAAAAIAGVSTLLSRRPQQLSGGERQRVALARALVREPSVFLLDEPLSSLDAGVRVAMRAEIRRVQRETGRAMLYVTHDQIEALTLGDRVAVIGTNGEIAQEGTPDEVFMTPANLTVATFLGTPEMNVIAGERDVAGVVRAGPFRVPGVGDEDRGGLVVGVRPEDVVVARAGEDASTGVVQAVEPAGSEAFVRVKVEGTEITVRVPADARPEVGGAVSIARSPRRAHLFHAGNGARVAGS